MHRPEDRFRKNNPGFQPQRGGPKDSDSNRNAAAQLALKIEPKTVITKSANGNAGAGDQNLELAAAKPSQPVNTQDGNKTQDKSDKKKFTGRCRLFFGNIPQSMTEDEFVTMIRQYGETDDIFLNAKKGFGFVKLETRSAAEACKIGLDGKEFNGRVMRVRFATHSAALQVKNLPPHCTNELLAMAFHQFGEIERAIVVVDDRGKSTGAGIVEFARRGAFAKAFDAVSKGVFLLSKCLRPVSVEPLEQKDEEDGLPEKYATKTNDYYEEMSVGPRFAEPGTFEFEIGLKWKQLEQLEIEKKKGLEEDMQRLRDDLELDMDNLIADHKAQMLRQDLMKRQAELNALEMERQQREAQRRREQDMRRLQAPASAGAFSQPGGFQQREPEQQLLIQQQALREMQMKHQHQQNRSPMMPPPTPPSMNAPPGRGNPLAGTSMNSSGGSAAGPRANLAAQSQSSFTGNNQPRLQLRQTRFDQPPQGSQGVHFQAASGGMRPPPQSAQPSRDQRYFDGPEYKRSRRF